jgi:hypothetical protein
MKHLTALFVTLILLCSLAPLSHAQSASVKLDVVVTEKDGKVITDLKQDELQIEDDGKKVEVKSFTPVSVPANSPAPGEGRVAVIVLDDTAPAAATEVIQGLAGTVLKATPPGAKVSVVRLHDTEDAGNYDPKTVIARLTGFQAGTRPFDTEQTPNDFLDRIAKIADGLGEPAGHRKAIVCVGQPTVCALGARTKNEEGKNWKFWTTAMNALGRSNASVYALLPVQLSAVDVSVVDFSGGTPFTNGNFQAAAERIWGELGNHYIVEYTPVVSSTKDVHAVSVKTTRKNAVVRARRQR